MLCMLVLLGITQYYDGGAGMAMLETFQEGHLLPPGSKDGAGGEDTAPSYYLTPLSEQRAEIIFSEQMEALACAES